MNKYLKAGVIGGSSLALFGCATTASNTQIGCAAGAVLGAIIGHQIDSDAGALIGGAVGAMVGCGVGEYLDEREKKLAELAKQNAMNTRFERVSEDAQQAPSFDSKATENIVAGTVSVSTEKPLFDIDSATISDPIKLQQLTSFLKGYIESIDPNSKIYIVGHTDASGSAVHNQQLSERRAYFIAKQLVALGAKPDMIFYEGVGENQPIASNDTAAGQAANRRFELHDVITTDKAKPVNNQQIARISTAKKQRVDYLVNTIPKEASTAISADTPSTAGSSKPGSGSKKPIPDRTDKSQDPLGLRGVPLNDFSLDVLAHLGTAEPESGLFAKAYASDLPLHSCAYSEPVVQSTLRSFNGAEIVPAKTSESVTNLYGTMWWSKVNTTGVALGPVGIAKDNMQPTHQPSFSFYRNYLGGNVQPDFKVPVSVETYRGKDAVLVRMYAKNDDSPFRCSDLVFSTKGEPITKTSGVIYSDNGELYGSKLAMQLVKI